MCKNFLIYVYIEQNYCFVQSASGLFAALRVRRRGAAGRLSSGASAFAPRVGRSVPLTALLGVLSRASVTGGLDGGLRPLRRALER